jgi:SulP family sulfate permease
VAIVGEVPQGLPPLTMPSFSPISGQLIPAVLISIIGFVESVSVAQTLAAKKRQRIDPDQELIGLGAANIGAAFTGGYPVTGGFARSVVNFDAGAETPAAGAYTAVGLLHRRLLLTPLIYFLPQGDACRHHHRGGAVAGGPVDPEEDLDLFARRFRRRRATILLTLGFGVEIGVTAGVVLSILIHLYKSSRPHVAEVGQGARHRAFPQRQAPQGETDHHPDARVDESLYFANARYLEDRSTTWSPASRLKHVILMCPAVNEIDMSALESLEAINERLKALGVTFHLSEVKGPVMDRLQGVPEPASGDLELAPDPSSNQDRQHPNQTKEIS